VQIYLDGLRIRAGGDHSRFQFVRRGHVDLAEDGKPQAVCVSLLLDLEVRRLIHGRREYNPRIGRLRRFSAGEISEAAR
jgi:hypothetical protein